jgi:antitoxin (DNA-binding transcriptional repressor) of toxin-antitoxin stability system
MTMININEAKTHLSRYAKRVKAGETIVLCDRNKAFAEIRPLQPSTPPKKRKLGQMNGYARVPDAFFESDASIETDFLAASCFPRHEVATRHLHLPVDDRRGRVSK